LFCYSYLLSVPSLSRALTGLYAVVDSRLASHRRMLGLSGRLDLLLAQIELRQRAAAVASASALEVAGEQHAAASVWDENDDELDEDQEDDAMLDGMDEDLDEEDDE
jgi:U3 small nucleolar RNA-associated protein 5